MALHSTIAELVPPSLRRPAIVSPSGTPRFWAVVYESIFLTELADATVRQRLLSIDALYNHVDESHGGNSLDRWLHEVDVEQLSTALESFFLLQRNLALQSDNDHRGRWLVAMDFVEKIVSRVVDSDTAGRAIRRRVHKLGAKLINLRPNPRTTTVDVVRAIPSRALQEIYDIFDPESHKNPFRGEVRRWRNHCLLLALLHQGLRRGEALLLSADAVKSGHDDTSLSVRHWINVQNLYEEEDPRYCDPPSIKNAQSIRQIPVSRDVAVRFQHFVENYRGRSPYPQLFLNSTGAPLGTRSVSNIMQAASAVLSEDAKRSLTDVMRQPKVTAHDFRHTCAVVRLYHYRSAGVPEDEALQKLRAFFGWAHGSEMPRKYARAYYERHVAEVWNDNFDAHIDAIRTIEHTRDA